MYSQLFRKSRLINGSLFILFCLATVFSTNADVTQASITDLIKKSGNATDEKERYRLLNELAGRQDLSKELRNDLNILLPVVDWWANAKEKAEANAYLRNGKRGYLFMFFHPQARLDRGGYPPPLPEKSALYPIWCYYKAKSLIWVPIQVGWIRGNPELRETYYSQARSLLKTAHQAYPANPVISMYAGVPSPWKNAFKYDASAPRWANLQREGLSKLTELIHWWIDNRQLKDGQFGGSWGDDVEMWRWWTPVLLGFKDDKIIAAQERLSNGIFMRKELKHGYTTHMTDVEHTSEDTSDALAPMLLLKPENPVWLERTKTLMDMAESQWMGINKKGYLQFKSAWFAYGKIDNDPKRACDTVYHARLFHPVLLYWLQSGDNKVASLMTRWLDTWVAAASESENGKPAGILPTAIHWPDGEAGGGVKPWWKPQISQNRIYNWSGAMSLMTRTLLLCWYMTGDRKYIQPILSMAKIRMKYLDSSPKSDDKTGSERWCALTGDNKRGMTTFLPQSLAKYRLLSGDSSFDEILRRDASGYMQMRMGLGMNGLERELEQNAKAFRINRSSYTDEARWTDRVLAFNARWGNEGNNWNWPVPKVNALYSSVTGDPGEPLYFPLNAVRWMIEPVDFAALVTDSGKRVFSADVYNFRSGKRSVPLRLLMLKPGVYSWTLSNDGHQVLQRGNIIIAPDKRDLTIDLPSGTLCHFNVKPSV